MSAAKSSPIGEQTSAVEPKPKRSRKPASPVLENGRIFTDRQLMARWSMTLAQVQRDLRTGRVPGGFRVTGGWRISEENLLKFERGLTPQFGAVAAAPISAAPVAVMPVAVTAVAVVPAKPARSKATSSVKAAS